MVGLKQAVIKHNLAKKHKQAFSQSLTYAWNEKKIQRITYGEKLVLGNIFNDA